MSVRRIALSSYCLAAVAIAVADASAQVPESLLPGRPDANVAASAAAPPVAAAATTAPSAVDDVAPVTLDPPFTSEVGGITVRPPAGGTMIRRASAGGDELVKFVSDAGRWRLVVSRVILGQPVPLSTKAGDAQQPVGARPAPGGFADSVAAAMPNETPGTFVRSELIPINGYDGALLATRYRDQSNAPFLQQQAVVRRTDKTYFVITYATPLSADAPAADVQADPRARRAVDAFERIVDSVQLIDQDQMKQDQDERLIRTRSLFLNWTPSRLKQAIVPEQWLRLIKDGKDVGYTYVVEELANDVPRTGKAKSEVDPAKATGVRIGVRSRTMPDAGTVNDAQTWMWVSFDRGQELFRNTLNVRVDPTLAKDMNPDFKPDAGAKPTDPITDYTIEGGTAIRRDRIVPQVVAKPGGLGNEPIGRRDGTYELQFLFSGKRQSLPAIKREAPPFYLPQALGHLLPRLLPLSSPKTYLFASYVSDNQKVMLRYVDVLPTTNIALAGQTFRAVPVQERIGIEGSITTHYVTPEGKYLGSVNEDNKITIVATDAATLKQIWKDAALERPGEVKEAADAPAAPPTIVRTAPAR